ncbi:MAG: S9 family peptidase [Rhodospirillales bacterium]|nr:S9 family peptidase [Rhodospirillales bacterium]MBO6787865.1 S9 family peptidase [Rhodospirillales bacterium]
MTTDDIRPPVADKHPTEITYHGHTRQDDYAWLKDENWQQVMHEPEVLDPAIRTYLEAENAYTQSWMADTGALQQKLFDEMRGRIKEDDSTVPDPDGAYAYYVRYVEGGQHPKYCRKPTQANDTETILLDGDAEAEGQDYYKIGAFAHASDHRIAAYAEDRNGSEIYTLRFRDMESGQNLADEIGNASADLEWAEDGKTLFYTVLDDNHRPSKVMRHVIGTPAADDVLVYEEDDPGYFVGLSKTESRRLILIDAHDHETSEVYMIPADKPDTAPRLIAPRAQGVEYSVSEHAGRLVILTNADGAEDFKIVTAPLDNPGRANWVDMIPHMPGSLLVGFEVFAEYLVRLERVAALPRIVVRQWDTQQEFTIRFEEEAYALGLEGGFEYATRHLRFSYSSPTTPRQVIDFNMASGDRTLLKQDEVPSGHNPADYITRRIQAVAPDGELVPVTVLYRADTILDGSAPVLLYGYGSYGMTMPASFVTPRLSLVDRGFIYAIAHIRGGMEKGYRWYTDGKREKKRNTFTDFIAAAEGLMNENLARPGSIAIHGGSAGGMLMGACVNLRPELWRAVVADVPFVDVLNTMCDMSLPLTPIEWPEWGNPIEDKAAYDYIRSYSPYDNVEAKDYPSLLATAGLTDPRVTYWEPAKWVAKLRDLKTDDNPLLLKTNMSAGHAGAAGRFDRLEELAFNYAFVLKSFGILS